MPMKERVDRLLVSRGLASSREKAQALIMAGLVFSGTERIAKPGRMMDDAAALTLKDTLPFVGRGGLKLAEALDGFGVDAAGLTAADIGSSTGGFTDCLLQRGARRVYAVDVDTRQLDWRLRRDPRVRLIEKNARYLSKADFGEDLDLVSLDVSFISLLKVLPAVRDVLKEGAEVLALVKPQFEAGRRQVGKKGVVRDPAVHGDVLNKVIGGAQALGFGLRGLMKCSARGQRGNAEFMTHFIFGKEPVGPDALRAFVKEAVGDESH